MHVIIKSTFYILFILISLFVGVNMILKSKGDKKVKLFGTTVLVLGIGESFHIVPRIMEIFSDDSNNFDTLIENGRFISSIAIIFFYLLLLWFLKLISNLSATKKLDNSIFALSIISIIISVILKNSIDTLSVMLRNLPMLLIGLLIVFNYRKALIASNDKSLRYFWLTILLTLVFTVSFELLSPVYPFFIILMMPKTLVYILFIYIGYTSFKKDFN